MANFRVNLDAYNGPLDLLLFLIRREEVDIYDIPIARITSQYVAYVRLLEALDPNLAGEFLVMAATLMELKSRTLLPTVTVEEEEEDLADPRMELVRQLLEYKKYKDAARSLGASAQIQALKHVRKPAALTGEPHELDIEEAQIWDLLEAFNRLLEQTGRRSATHDVAYDDTPIALHAADVVDSLQRSGGSQRFEDIFEGRTKSELIGLFLALLELIRQRRVRAEQSRPFESLTVHLLEVAEEFDAEHFDEPELDQGIAPEAGPPDDTTPAPSEPEPTTNETAPDPPAEPADSGQPTEPTDDPQ